MSQRVEQEIIMITPKLRKAISKNVQQWTKMADVLLAYISKVVKNIFS